MARRTSVTLTDRDLGWQRIKRALRASATAVEVGVRADGAARNEGPSNAEIAAWHEYGTSRVPQRSFLRSTFDQKFPLYRALAGALGRKVVVGLTTKEKALVLLGAKFSADIKARIRGHIPPPLADSTVERKGSSTPLIDTGQLIGSISYKVIK